MKSIRKVRCLGKDCDAIITFNVDYRLCKRCHINMRSVAYSERRFEDDGQVSVSKGSRVNHGGFRGINK